MFHYEKKLNLKMSGCDTLHLQILAGVAGQLEHLSGDVLQYGGLVDGGSGAHPPYHGPLLQVAVNPATNITMM